MDRLKDAGRGLSSKSMIEPVATARKLPFEPMAEYKPTRDEEDLAYFGKQQQLLVCDRILLLLSVHRQAVVTMSLLEELRLFVYPWPNMHIDDHLGRNPLVSHDPPAIPSTCS